jgi:hypothetical protein
MIGKPQRILKDFYDTFPWEGKKFSGPTILAKALGPI